MQIVRPVVETVGGVGARVRDLGRLQEVARVLVGHGLGLLVAGLPGLPTATRSLETSPEKVVAALQRLGPTFVKLGQILSTRPDVVPDAYCDVFTQLQDDAAPLAFEVVARQLDEALGPDWRARVTIDEAPLATGSIAQVHRGMLPDGRAVVLKVQRPGIAPTIRADLRILALLAERLLAEYPEARSFDPRGVLGEFERSITAELDFVQEAENMRRFARLFEGDATVRIPGVVTDLTTPTVLCMDFLDGVKIREARAAGCDMQRVGERYLKVAYDMMFVHGFFHGDLHPGNVFVLPGDVIGLVDMGMVGRLTRDMRDNVISIMFALQRGDYRTIARLFYEIALKEERLDYRKVERETIEVMEQHWSAGGSVKDMSMGPFVMDLARRAARQGCRIPASYAMLFKAIVTSEGLAKNLIEEVDPIAAITPYFEKMVQERFGGDAAQRELMYLLITGNALLQRLPLAAGQLLDDLDAERVGVEVRHRPDPARERLLDRRLHRTLFAVFACVFTVCGTAALFLPWPWGLVVAGGFWTLATGATGLVAWGVLRG
jgi:ubiquinone biosynthesis protein